MPVRPSRVQLLELRPQRQISRGRVLQCEQRRRHQLVLHLQVRQFLDVMLLELRRRLLGD